MTDPPFPEDAELECDKPDVLQAVKNDDVQALKAAVNDPSDIITFKNAPKKSMLAKPITITSLILLCGAEKCTKYIINEYPPQILSRGDIPPILYAAAGGNLNVFKIALKVVKNVKNAVDDRGYGINFYAAKYNRVNIVQYIYLNKLYDDSNKNATPLMWAAQNGAVDVIRFFIDNDICKINQKTVGDWTALHYAASANSVDAVKCLISSPNIEFTRNSKDQTPLHIALCNGNATIVALLVDAGFVNEKDAFINHMLYRFNNNLEKSAREVEEPSDDQKFDCIRVFLRNRMALAAFGMDIFVKSFECAFSNAFSQASSANSYEFKVLSLVCEEAKSYGDQIPEETFMRFMSNAVQEPKAVNFIDNLFDLAPFNPNWKDEEGKNLIHYALIDGNEEMIKKLIARNVNINQHDNKGKRMIQYAADVSQSMLKVIVESPSFDKFEFLPELMSLLTSNVIIINTKKNEHCGC